MDTAATVAWSFNFKAEFKVEANMKKFCRGSAGDSVQMQFEVTSWDGPCFHTAERGDFP
jgi:hypothetical protein